MVRRACRDARVVRTPFAWIPDTLPSELDSPVNDDDGLQRAYTVFSLRNVAERALGMDAGQFTTLAEVLDHDNRTPSAPSWHTEPKSLPLKAGELRQLEAFLRALSGPKVGTSLPPLVSVR